MPVEVGLLLLKYPLSTVRCQRHAVRSSVRLILESGALEIAANHPDLFLQARNGSEM